MRSSVRSAVLTVASLALFVVPASPAAASAFCSFKAPVTLSPGLTAMTPTTGTFTTGGATGMVMCHGDAYGMEITGPGKMEFAGTYGDGGPETCASGKGSGKGKLTLPTAGGPMEVSYAFTFQRLLAMGPFSSSNFNGGFGFFPAKGDCLSAPLTGVTVYGGGMIGGY